MNHTPLYENEQNERDKLQWRLLIPSGKNLKGDWTQTKIYRLDGIHQKSSFNTLKVPRIMPKILLLLLVNSAT